MYRMLIAALIVALVVVGCNTDEDSETNNGNDNEPNTEAVELTISGSGSVVALLRGLEADFEADTPGVNLSILSGSGTGGGVAGVADGQLDVAAMARPPKDSELEAAPSFIYESIGQGGIALFTHPGVGITDLTTEQVYDILLGETTTWAEVGGPDETIVLFVRDEEETSTKLLRDSFLGDDAYPESAVILTSAGDMISAIESAEWSVGYGTWPATLGAEAAVTGITLDGVSPSAAEYPMLTSLGIGYLADNAEAVQPLVDWLQSEQGQARLAVLGVVTE